MNKSTQYKNKRTTVRKIKDFLILPKAYHLGCVRFGDSGIRIYSGIYSGYSAPGSGIAGMEIQVYRNENREANGKRQK